MTCPSFFKFILNEFCLGLLFHNFVSKRSYGSIRFFSPFSHSLSISFILLRRTKSRLFGESKILRAAGESWDLNLIFHCGNFWTKTPEILWRPELLMRHLVNSIRTGCEFVVYENILTNNRCGILALIARFYFWHQPLLLLFSRDIAGSTVLVLAIIFETNSRGAQLRVYWL